MTIKDALGLDKEVKQQHQKAYDKTPQIYQVGIGQYFSAEQAGIDKYLASPCYEKIGFDPFDSSLKEEYRICEEQYYKDLYYNYAIFGLSIILFIIISIATYRRIIKHKKIKQIESSSEASKEFNRKYVALNDLLKAKAIPLKDYRKKVKELIQEADLIMQKSNFELQMVKLKEAFDSGVISQRDYTNAVNSIKGSSSKPWKAGIKH